MCPAATVATLRSPCDGTARPLLRPRYRLGELAVGASAGRVRIFEIAPIGSCSRPRRRSRTAAQMSSDVLRPPAPATRPPLSAAEHRHPGHRSATPARSGMRQRANGEHVCANARDVLVEVLRAPASVGTGGRTAHIESVAGRTTPGPAPLDLVPRCGITRGRSARAPAWRRECALLKRPRRGVWSVPREP